MGTMRVALITGIVIACVAGLCPIVWAVSVPVSIGASRQIIAGVQVGPVGLGMLAAKAERAALEFERATRCEIDLLIVDGRVAAAGTRHGACLEVSVPTGAAPVADWLRFPPMLPDPIVGGPASAFIATFGDPLKVRLAANRMALMWPQGIVVHISGFAAREAVVTYVAVVARGSEAIPAIGHFRAGDGS